MLDRHSPALAAALLAATLAPALAAPVRFDFNTDTSPTQQGWNPAPSGIGSDGTVSISTVALGAASLATRDRGAGNTDGGGGDSANNDMWRDFVFANGSTSANPGSGLEIVITGLVPDRTYPLRVWGFDDSSNSAAGSPGRSADWSAGLTTATLTFPNSPDPTSLASYVVTVNGAADGTGTIVLTGLVAAASPDAQHNVFINGLEVGNFLGDADGDGMQDAFEQDIIDFDPLDEFDTIEDVLAGGDFDMDGSINAQEEARGTSPTNPDTDGDSLLDGVETGTGTWISETQRGTSPFVTDSDSDGLPDGVENPDLPYDPNDPLNQPGTDPNLLDTDLDGAFDFEEITVYGTDPTDPSDVYDPLVNMIVMFDFNAPGSPVQAGWVPADLGNGSDGTISVTTEVIDGGAAVTVDTRDRNNNTDDPNADVAHADMWRDFVFANGSFSSAPGSGLRLTLSGLQPLTTYPILIWAFDDSSDGNRRADWGVSGEAPIGTLTFRSSPDPVSPVSYLLEFEAESDNAGQIVIDGVVAAESPSGSHNVFVNGLAVGSPTGSTLPLITDFAYDPATGEATITWTSTPGAIYALDASFDLSTWFEIIDNIASEGAETTYIETFLGPEPPVRFYQVRLLP